MNLPLSQDQSTSKERKGKEGRKRRLGTKKWERQREKGDTKQEEKRKGGGGKNNRESIDSPILRMRTLKLPLLV